uniref:Secreted protein n=1 Tax=Ananas comosus var. bracteatus TaxID=296719 RepID=A0A6V7P423_ANACO|nr:unnamed protein product [Ananas comosus var. bracteatus]
MPTSGLTRMLVFLGGALSGTLVEAALAAQHATEEPRGGGGNSTATTTWGMRRRRDYVAAAASSSVDRLAINKDKSKKNKDQQWEKDYADGDVGAHQSAGLPRRSAYFQVGRGPSPLDKLYQDRHLWKRPATARCVRENQSSVTLKLYYLQNGSARLGFW